MDYEKMWNKLKEQITSDLEHHKSGEMQSMSESIQGEIKCKEILKLMARIEDSESETESK